MAKVQKNKGSTVRVWGYFTDPDSTTAPVDPETGKTLIDPTTVTFKVRSPGGTVTTKVYGTDAEVVKSSVGVYVYRLNLSEEGTYHYQWVATVVNGGIVIRGELDSMSKVDF